MTRTRIVPPTLASGLCLALWCFNAPASDDKVFNGAMCSFTEPDHYAGEDRFTMKLLNTSGQTETVSCPLKRDSADASVAQAYVIGSALIDEDTCIFWEREDDFSYSTHTHNHVESVAPNYNKTVFAHGASNIALSNFASLQITCDVPDGAGIYNYSISEN